ncbi:DUF433 domain-containing protein [Chlorogloeopsis fritschii]|uniref:DUF433 domain-containing protein n=1 Tax=Chlorogloeopsis fritschii TaxID=1124 RepID=UPI0023F50997|nr:hypothetical protein [Chlorogloeopsis fritschii]
MRTRISLDLVVYAFLNGEYPESIPQNFPLLSLKQVYGAMPAVSRYLWKLLRI